MSELQLKTVTRTQGNNAALKDGVVRPATCNLVFEEVPVLVDAFRKMVRELAYDVCEMALTTYLCAKAHGAPFTALPVFLVRGFHHGAIIVRDPSSIREPADLKGRRVGVNRGYTVTTGLWARAILQEEHGVDLAAINWAPSGDEHVAQYVLPPNVVPLPHGSDLRALLAAGELAAVVGVGAEEGSAPLLFDPAATARRALATRGFYPINHLVVARDDVLAAHPEVAADLFASFAAAKRRYVAALGDQGPETKSATDRLYGDVMEITGEDPLPYGIAPNRAMLEAVIAHAVAQRILDRPLALEEIFAAGTHDLVG